MKDMVGEILTQLGRRGDIIINGSQGSTLLSPVHTEKGSQNFNNS